MREACRIFRGRTLLLLLVMCLINTGLFILCSDSNKDITLQGEALEQYIQEYPEYIERTAAQTDKMSTLGIYRTGYSAQRLQKTKAAYETMEDMEVQAGDNRGILLLVNYRLTDVFVIAFVFLMVMDFDLERKKGLHLLVRGTVKGRTALYLQRIFWLACGTLLAIVLLYGQSYLCARMTFGLEDLGRSLQSLPEFSKCTKAITIREFFLQVILRKALAAYFVGLLLYLCMGIWSEGLALTGAAVLCTEQIATAFLIEPVSKWNVLKYVNLYTMLNGSEYYKNNIYLNLFEHAISGEKIAEGILFAMFPILLTAGALLYGKSYLSSRRGGVLIEKLMKAKERLRSSHTFFGWECYKFLVKQKAGLILVVALVLQYLLAFQYDYYYPIPTFQQLFYIEFRGELTQEAYDGVCYKQYLLETAREGLEEALAEAKSKNPPNEIQIHNIEELIVSNQEQQRGLLPVLQNMQDGMNYVNETGHNICIVEPFSYDLLLNQDVQTKRRGLFLELIGIVMGVAGVYSLEKQKNTRQLLRQTYRGRQQEWVVVPVIITVYCFGFSVGIYAVQLLHIMSSLGLPDLEAPVQSLPFMRTFPLYLSIRGYLVLLFLVRGLIAVMLGLLMGMISKLSSSRIMAIGVGASLVILLLLLVTGMQEMLQSNVLLFHL